MDIQQLTALALVAVAAIYLGRNAWSALKGLLSGKGGCASGCGKCAFAGKETAVRARSSKPARPDIIPLSDIKSVSTIRRPPGSS
ncbi:MAG TPA: hypothetical protein VFB38_19050 [Chthonomonadaceae bacterium]|nr:hypothetical protein [Chthonomonadaceae bacterium]